MKEFYIDKKFLCNVQVKRRYVQISNPEAPTEDDLVSILDGTGILETISFEDHPTFIQFRDMLQRDGYIVKDNRVYNNDTVIKPFKVNGIRFRPGHRFLSASALGCIKVS